MEDKLAAQFEALYNKKGEQEPEEESKEEKSFDRPKGKVGKIDRYHP